MFFCVNNFFNLMFRNEIEREIILINWEGEVEKDFFVFENFLICRNNDESWFFLLIFWFLFDLFCFLF